MKFIRLIRPDRAPLFIDARCIENFTAGKGAPGTCVQYRDSRGTSNVWVDNTPEDIIAQINGEEQPEKKLTISAAYRRIEFAATALYLAGPWTYEARLWTELRDALGLPAGTATPAGVGSES